MGLEISMATVWSAIISASIWSSDQLSAYRTFGSCKMYVSAATLTLYVLLLLM
jgi:hypothetical protein